MVSPGATCADQLGFALHVVALAATVPSLPSPPVMCSWTEERSVTEPWQLRLRVDFPMFWYVTPTVQ